MSRFAGKVAIITGSSNGIGRATALLFAAHGAKVTITGRNKERLEETAKLIGDVNMVVGDITNSTDQDRIITTTMEKYGRIDILVNNAGAAMFDATGALGVDTDVATFDSNLAVNLKSVIEMTRKVKPYLMKTKGEIVNVSSIVGGPQASVEPTYYSTAKAALTQYTRNCAVELIAFGIRVNCVSPGIISTGFMTAVGASEENSNKFFEYCGESRKFIPIGRVGQPEEVAKLIAFLSDREASEFIIGQNITIDGGSTLVMALTSKNLMEILR